MRVDTEHLGKSYVEHPEDLAVGEFLTGGEAWVQYRQGPVDGQKFGVAGVDFAWGSAEISGNAVPHSSQFSTLLAECREVAVAHPAMP